MRFFSARTSEARSTSPAMERIRALFPCFGERLPSGPRFERVPLRERVVVVAADDGADEGEGDADAAAGGLGLPLRAAPRPPSPPAAQAVRWEIDWEAEGDGDGVGNGAPGPGAKAGPAPTAPRTYKKIALE